MVKDVRIDCESGAVIARIQDRNHKRRASLGGDDPANDPVFRSRTISKNQGDVDLIRKADRDESQLFILLARILHH